MNDSPTQHYYQDPQTPRQFEERRFYGAFGQWLKEWDLAFFTRHPLIDYGNLRDILELGCGTGRITRAMMAVAPQANLLAVDRSAEMLDELVRRLAAPPPSRLHLSATSVESLDYPPQSFDLVYFSRFLMHITDWQAALGKACSLSRQWILFDIPVHGSLASLGKKVLDHLKPPPGDGQYLFFNLQEIIEVLHQNGFALADHRRLLLLPIPVHLRLGMPALSLGVEQILGGEWMKKKVGSPVYLLARRGTAGE